MGEREREGARQKEKMKSELSMLIFAAHRGRKLRESQARRAVFLPRTIRTATLLYHHSPVSFLYPHFLTGCASSIEVGSPFPPTKRGLHHRQKVRSESFRFRKREAVGRTTLGLLLGPETLSLFFSRAIDLCDTAVPLPMGCLSST